MAFSLKEEMRSETPEAPEEPVASEEQAQVPSIQIELDESMQDVLVDVVLDDFDKAKADRQKRDYGITSKGEKLNFDDWFKRLKDMYNGDRIPKTIPWKFCSNRSLRIATSVLDLLHARLFPAVWNEDLTRWRAGNFVDVPKAERISKFMDWWIRVHNPLRPFYDKWVKYTTGFGDALTETYWDVEELTTNETVDVPMTGEDGVPLTNTDGTPAVQKQVKVNRVEKTLSRTIQKDNVYLFENARDIQRDPVIIKETILFKDLEDLEKRGACLNTQELAKHIIVPEPAGNIDEDKKERLKKIKLRNMPVEVIREYLHYDIDGTGINESIKVMVASEHRVYLGGVRMRDITKSGRRPLDFTKYDSYLDRPDDLDGEGVLTKVRELAEEIDAIFNQITDANTLSVLRPFFYDPSGDIDAPALQLGPNSGIPVTDPQKNVYFPDMQTRVEALINAIKLVLEFIERLTAASSYVMGKESEQAGGSGTATRTNAIVQAADIRFSLPSERLRFGASRILQQHLDLIQLNIPPGMEEKVLGEKGEKIFQNGEITDEGISGEYYCFLLADPSMGSKETERNMLSQLYAVLIQNPIVMSDPAKIYAVTSDTLKAYGRDEGQIQKWLGPPPLPDDITDPEDENTLMLQGDFERVTPQLTENHLLHIMKHSELMQSPSFQEISQTAPALSEQVMQYNQQHIQQHMQMMQQMMTLMKPQKGQGGGGFTGNSNPSEEAGNQQGVGNMQGPMGEAVNTQREGKVGQSKTP